MTLATLDKIGDPSEPWGDNHLVFIELRFADHEPARFSTKEGYVDARLKDLAERVGHPEEWEFGESKNGKPTVKIPKPEDAVPSGGGKGKWTPKTPEERAEILAMNAMSAWANVTAAVVDGESFGPQWDTIQETKRAMRELLAEARSILNVEARVTTPGHSPESPRAPASTPVGEEGTAHGPGLTVAASEVGALSPPAPSSAGTTEGGEVTTPPHPYLGNRDIAEPCRVLGCELQEENPIHVPRNRAALTGSESDG